MSTWTLGAGLEDRVVLVTGAAQGIGRSTVLAMASAGARVVAIDVNARGATETVELADQPSRHLSYHADLRNISAIPEIVRVAQEKVGSPWALAHVAAVVRRQSIDDVTEEDWDFQLDVNLKAGFFLNRAAANAMIAGGVGGRLINFSSAGFLRGPMQGSHVYVASKGGVVGLTRGFARAYGKHAITVNTVMPGQIDTPMQRMNNTPETMAATIASCPLERMGTPDEVASVVVFLASTHSSFITGAAIMVSGGAMMY